jgi:hypothetical protein
VPVRRVRLRARVPAHRPRGADLEAHHAAATAAHLQLTTATTKALEASFDAKIKLLEINLTTKTSNLERELQDLRKLVVQKVGNRSASTPVIKRESAASPDTTTALVLALPYGGQPSPPNELDALRSDVHAGEKKVEGLRSDAEAGKEEVEELRKALKVVQSAHEYDTLDVHWAVDPALLVMGANVNSGDVKPRHDV